MEKHGGGRPTENLSQPVTGFPPTLNELGIDRMDSSRWQQVASLPEGAFEQHIKETKQDGKELTTSSVLRKAKDVIREQTHRWQKLAEMPRCQTKRAALTVRSF